MKDTSYPIRKAYYALITGLGYTCFDFKASDTAVKPYVILSSQTSQSEGTKNRFGSRATINIDIITSFDDGFGGRKGLDLIVNNILQAVMPSPGETAILCEGFNIYSIKKLIDFDFEPLQQSTQTIFRRIITFEHLIEEA
jgi:hypothetical protein